MVKLFAARRNQTTVPFSTVFCNGALSVGSWSTLGKGFWYDGTVELGSYCSIGPNVSLIGTRHSFRYAPGNHRYLKSIGVDDDIVYEHIRVGDNVFIGRGAIVLAGVSIGDNAIIGAGSIVTSDVPADSIYAGNPARKIRDRNATISV
jgi:acetyltransferase-like isoleucine patch superfamily enzyme